MGVGEADLDLELLSSVVDGVVVEVLDDFVARITTLEAGMSGQWHSLTHTLQGINIPSKSDATTVTVLVAEDARRADLVWSEKVGELVLVHRLGKVGHVEVGVTLIGKCLELRVEGLAGEADFVSEIVEATDAVLGVFVVVVLDEAEAGRGEVSEVNSIV